jgi:hypothetical protein
MGEQIPGTSEVDSRLEEIAREEMLKTVGSHFLEVIGRADLIPDHSGFLRYCIEYAGPILSSFESALRAYEEKRTDENKEVVDGLRSIIEEKIISHLSPNETIIEGS